MKTNNFMSTVSGIYAAMAVRALMMNNRVFGADNIARVIQRNRKSYYSPSYNDNPNYRKSIWPESKMAKPGRMD